MTKSHKFIYYYFAKKRNQKGASRINSFRVNYAYCCHEPRKQEQQYLKKEKEDDLKLVEKFENIQN